jgi:parallel beta-helix repeat protein
LLPGVHRTGETEPKDGMTFEGIDGAVMNGSRLLEGFQETGDGWDVAGVELNMNPHGECVDGYEACALRNDLYVDDEMMWRVDSRDELAPGTWWSDGRRVVMADNPEGRKVEVSLTEHAFRSDADNVTIRNLVIEKYAPMAQRGALQAEDSPGSRGTNWLIENVEVRLNHGAGIRAGDQTIIRSAYIHHNGQMGITSDGGEGILVESSEIAYNNIRGFNWGWEGAGTKFKETVGLVVRDVTVHHNLGPGLWTDINNRDTTYEGNVVFSNHAAGIFHEISFDAVIRDNEVYDNGFIMDDWLWGAGILIAASTGVEVYNNTVTNNADGITGIQQQRERDGELWRLADLNVHDNTITMWYGQTGVVQDMGDSSVFTDRNIVFENNTYVGAGHEAFAWDDQDLDWESWLATGQGQGSTIPDG